jgi:hypothetical protein
MVIVRQIANIRQLSSVEYENGLLPGWQTRLMLLHLLSPKMLSLMIIGSLNPLPFIVFDKTTL